MAIRIKLFLENNFAYRRLHTYSFSPLPHLFSPLPVGKRYDFKRFRPTSQYLVGTVVFLLSLITFVSTPALTFARNPVVQAAQQQESKQAEFWVSGTCEACKKDIETTAKNAKGVKKAEWDIKTKIVTIDYDPAKTNPAALKKALLTTGRKVKLSKR